MSSAVWLCPAGDLAKKNGWKPYPRFTAPDLSTGSEKVCSVQILRPWYTKSARTCTILDDLSQTFVANGLLVYVGSCWFKHWVSPRLPLFTCFIRSDSPRGEGLNNSPWKMLRRTRRWMCSSEKHPWAFEWLISKRHLRWTSCAAIPCICREQSKSGLTFASGWIFSLFFQDVSRSLRKTPEGP